MNDLNTITARLQLRNARALIDQHDDLMDLALGLWLPSNGLITPTAVSRAQLEAWERVKKQLSSLGPRVLERKMSAVLGDVGWGGQNDALDDALLDLDVRSLARAFLQQYIITGIMAGVAITPPGRAPTIRRLGGYLQGIPSVDDADVIVGLYRVIPKLLRRDASTLRKDEGTALRYDVEVYDWEEAPADRCHYRVWRNLKDPTNLGFVPEETPDAPRPRYRVRQRTPEGLAIGELEQLAPSLIAVMANEARQFRSEEMSAFGILKVIGSDVPDGFSISPSEVLALDEGASAEWMQPASLAELREQHRVRLERVRNDGSLPGGFLGNDSPSGEALSEARLDFRQNTSAYAVDLSDVLTELVEDFAGLVGVEPNTVSVTPSKEHDMKERIETTLTLREKNIIPLSVAVNAIREYFPSWSDEDANAWIDEQSATLNPDDITRLLASPPTPPPENEPPEVEADA